MPRSTPGLFEFIMILVLIAIVVIAAILLMGPVVGKVLNPTQVPTEVPATSIPEQAQVAEEPTSTDQVVEPISETIYFRIKYQDVPRGFFFGTDVDVDPVLFYMIDGDWEVKTLKPDISTMGPLFNIDLKEGLHGKSGSCGVNTINYNDFSSRIAKNVVVQPVCETIASETQIYLTLGLSGCEVVAGNVACTKQGNLGTLRYSLNKDLNKFQFSYDGTWDYAYEGWIRQALGALGFVPIPENYFDAVLPENHIIYKTAP